MARGGSRAGAGRPPVRTWMEGFEIGQACEVLWREASNAAFEERKRQVFSFRTSIQSLWDSAKAIPLSRRKAWLESEGYKEDHVGDLETWLHKLAGTPFDDVTGTYPGPAPRGLTISVRPPKGTRGRIIAQVAAQFDISSDTANRLWKAYRRFEREE